MPDLMLTHAGLNLARPEVNVGRLGGVVWCGVVWCGVVLLE